ncbi:MAG: Gldg family protein [Kofleriaceae bacterium]
MRTASPWWVSLVFGVGLLFVFLGERLLSLKGATVIGVGAIIVMTGARAWSFAGSSGTRKQVERTLLLAQLGVILSLILYMLTTGWGPTSLNTGNAKVALSVMYVVVLIASIVPLFMIELSLGTAMRNSFDVRASTALDASSVEYFRVRDIGWSGLAIAFALGLLMMTCNVARERNVSRDVSYFKTSAPGDSTKAIAKSSTETIRVLLFFPQINEVGTQLTDYFESLARNGKVTVTTHDRYVDAALGDKYKVPKLDEPDPKKQKGYVVLARGEGDKEKFFPIEIPADLETARKAGSKLRNLDREVNSILLKLVREKRKAYVMVGHGELNDPDSIPTDKKGLNDWGTSMFKKRLGELNYEIKELGLIDLSKDVPEDATVVCLLAPTIPLQQAEWDALDRYLDRGGRLLLALDPQADQTVGPLEGRLGYRIAPGVLTDGDSFLPQRRTLSDRRFVITTQFSAHASTTSLSRSVDKGLVLIEAGALEDAPFTTKGEAPKKTVTLRSMDSSWLDLGSPANFTFDATTEKKQRWTIGAAVEGPRLGDKDGFRALVFSDVQLFADAKVQSRMGPAQTILISGPLLDDAVKWLGGEETFVGDVVSEEDKPIKHTKDQDQVWFALTTIGAPLLVLTLGLVGTRKRRAKKKSEVKP